MEQQQLLHQRFVFASITPYRDFSIYQDTHQRVNRLKSEAVIVNDDDDLFEDSRKFKMVTFEPIKIDSNKRYTHSFTLPCKAGLDKKRKNSKYFYSPDSDEQFELIPFFKGKNEFYTTNERHIKRHFGRPFSSIQLTIQERKIHIGNDKLTVKVDSHISNRGINCKFFRKKWFTRGCTINLKTGDIYTFERTSTGTNRVRKNVMVELERIFQNNFLFLEDKVNNIVSYPENKRHNALNIRNKYKTELSDHVFISTLRSVFTNMGCAPTEEIEAFSNEIIYQYFYRCYQNLFVRIKNIKTPNEFSNLLLNWYPTKKFLVKNDNKLVAAILDRMNIKSKQTIKLVHENPDVDLMFLYLLSCFFGKDLPKFLSNLNPQIFQYKISQVTKANKKWFQQLKDHPYYQLTDSEKSIVSRLLNECVTQVTDEDKKLKNKIGEFLKTLVDHFRMRDRILPYHPEIKITANCLRTFNDEHIRFARLERQISRGYTIDLLFDQDVINKVEQPIETGNGTFYPVILKNDGEYISEGSHMHHCVGGYIEYSSSVIVSLRHMDPSNHERITCEFRDKKNIQSKYFCNANPPQYFEVALHILNGRIENLQSNFIHLQMIKTPIPVVEVKMGQVEVAA